jgi:hypothetical protein
MDTPEKLAAQVTQDEEKQKKNTRQHVSETTTRNQTRMVCHSLIDRILLDISSVSFLVDLLQVPFLLITHLSKLML